MAIKEVNYKSLKDKRVLLRIDINSPLVKGKVQDNPRFKESAETIRKILKSKAKLVILAHQGRKGDKDYSDLSQHAKILSKHIKSKINYIPYLFEINTVKEISKLASGKAIILRNVRDYEDEKEVEKKDNRFMQFSQQFDYFINDAFSVSHRNQGSIIIPPRFIKSFAGPNLSKEISNLDKFKLSSKSCIILGGSKVEDYLILFENLPKDRKIIASGVLGNLFLVANGAKLGYDESWLREKGYLELLPQLSNIYEKYKSQIILPEDFAFDIKGRKEFSLSDLPIESKIMDIGSLSILSFIEEMQSAKAFLMKGPMGYSELKGFEKGTVMILEQLSKITKKGGKTLIAGGHLSTTIAKYKIKPVTYISSSGGALLHYISGKELPGIKALESSPTF